MNNKNLLACAMIASLATGCASITGSTSQSVSVRTKDQSGTEVQGAACDLTNKNGTWFINTPGSVVVHRSNDDMNVTCKKDGQPSGSAAVVSDIKGSMFGNIIFGGGIGAVIDHVDGSAYEYPTLIEIVMGTSAKIESPRKPVTQGNNPMGQSSH
ncbi:MAG TPA: hypothetical protein VIE17_00015 [Methylophilaceae bacterium]